MFWKRKSKENDASNKIIAQKLLFLKRLMGADWHGGLVFDLDHFEVDSTDQREAAHLVFDKIKQAMGLEKAQITLDFFWEKPIKPIDPFAILKTADLFKGEKLTLGTYREYNAVYIIEMEMSVLRHNDLLVYSLAHELAHYILLGQKQLFFNDEKLTDLLVLAMGFGRFWCALQTNGKDVPAVKTGYLSRTEGIYALAWLEHHKKESQLRLSIKDKELSKNFKQCLLEIRKDKETKSLQPQSAQELLPSFVYFLTSLLDNRIIDYNADDSFFKNLVLYNDQVKKGKAMVFKKNRKSLVTSILEGIHAYRAKNDRELQLVQNAIGHIGLYYDEPLRKTFYQDIMTQWKENVHLRNQDLKILIDAFNENRKLQPELLFNKRNELVSVILPLLKSELDLTNTYRVP